MAKAGRFVCIFIPMLLTIAALIFLIMVGLGGTNAKNNYLSNLYFMQANTTDATGNPKFTGNPASDYIDPSGKTPDGKIIIQNYYSVFLWNFCAGSGDNTTRSILAFGQQSAQTVDFCTGRRLQFAFKPSEAWGLNSTFSNPVFGSALNSALDNYENKISKWMSTLYILAVTACSIELLVGIGGLFSRLGSLFTTLSALVTTAFAFAFSILATTTYFGLTAAFNEALNKQGVDFRVGKTIYIYMWFSVACSFTAALFWAFSSCCCSGRSRTPAPGQTMAERTPYTYERVNDAPYGASQTVTGARPGAYAPLRHN